MNLFKSLFNPRERSEEDEREKNEKKNFEILKYDGIRAFHMQRADYAVECFKRAADIREDAEVYDHLANAYVQLGKWEEAQMALDRWIRFEPENARPRISLAHICFVQEDYERMHEVCRKALEVETDDPRIYYLAARANAGLQNLPEAIAQLDKAIELKTDYADAYLLRAKLLADTDDPNSAKDDVEKLLSLDPENEDAALLKARLELSEGQVAEAERSIRTVIESNPFNRSAYLLLGKLFQTNEAWEKAIAVYSDAIDVLPEFAEAYRERSRARLETGDEKGAETDLEKAETFYPPEETLASSPDYENMKRHIPF